MKIYAATSNTLVVTCHEALKTQCFCRFKKEQLEKVTREASKPLPDVPRYASPVPREAAGLVRITETTLENVLTQILVHGA